MLYPPDSEFPIKITKAFAHLGPLVPKYSDWIFFEDLVDVESIVDYPRGGD